MTPRLCTIGNAIVDLIGETSDDVLASTGLTRAGMTLVDAGTSKAVRSLVGDLRAVAGGSCANTAKGFATLGGSASFVGRIGRDQLGDGFVSELAATGVRCAVPQAEGHETGHCVVLVTPDGERTMATHLGAAAELCVEDMIEAMGHLSVADAILIEGYVLDSPRSARAVDAILDGIRAARAGPDAARRTKIALTLSDPGCVLRHRDFVHSCVSTGIVDVVLANESEFQAAWPDADGHPVAGSPTTIVVTRGARGCTLLRPDVDPIDLPAAPVARLVDTTGAGDMFAAGYLYALLSGASPVASCEVAAIVAADAVGRRGAIVDPSDADLARIRSIVGRDARVGNPEPA